MNLPQTCYEKQTDEALAVAAQEGDEAACEFLLDRFKGTVRDIARTYFLVGADSDDVIQEGMIGLYKAVRSFDGARDATFATFAALCVRRQIVSAVRSATRLKNIPLNDYISLSPQDEHSGSLEAAEILPDPAEAIIRSESEKLMRERLMRLLSRFEWQVLGLFLSGTSYREIAARVGKDIKAVDNALRRVRQKLNADTETQV